MFFKVFFILYAFILQAVNHVNNKNFYLKGHFCIFVKAFYFFIIYLGQSFLKALISTTMPE